MKMRCLLIMLCWCAAMTVLMTGCTTAASTAAPSAPAAAPADSCAAMAEPTARRIAPGSGITPPNPVYRVEPVAPRAVLGLDAVATVEAVIGEDGKVRHICYRDGDREWAAAVAEALRNWRFEPAKLDGKPVATLFTLTTKLRRRM
jgi:DMSO/TMAO reductase YedYZ molybdopterin-dependent catalytic subunit